MNVSIELFSVIISFIALGISFVVAFRDIWLTRKNVKVIQTNDGSRSGFLRSYDGCNKTYSGKAMFPINPDISSVALIEIIITNKSSLPISILEFSIPDFPEFNSYTHVIDYFTVTIGKGSKVSFGSEKDPLNYLQPEFTLQPYSSTRGYLFFWSGIESDFLIDKKIPLTILTSRGIVKEKIIVSSQYESINKYAIVTMDENNKEKITIQH